ncbi:DPP IV N-terminal domain-containing protein [Paraflavitalea sp. CAU 1676]|uniref:S9 family peptidase n=1 Tax=Paraflavitalea sp. CAU 1676 TaxID=3032598 RepID=UPI0023DB6145|nr:DPP IV N-terminal domain-containing protein [Paraflavitalea sp. CAU 1676]MDF2187099.1 DPP IV N-terminal domain-containing protein [Paraflavitalea sp. CAU 1676]
MRKLFLFGTAGLLLLAGTNSATAQKKEFTYEQLFKTPVSGITKPLPVIRGWVNDESYIEQQKDASGNAAFVAVNVKSGKSTPYTGAVPSEQRQQAVPAIGIPDARNITASPDGKFFAFTKKDNNLYIMELASKKVTQVTKDGSETILNGYASWVYYEEILGRASRYKAFWWSPDSKNVCYMRFDDSKVPVFPIYVLDGQDGYLENERYPKAGEKNPEVKIGVASAETGATVWADFNQQEDQYFGAPYWTPDGQLWAQWMNRDQNKLVLYNINLTSGAKDAVYTEEQKTWIDLDEASRIEFLSAGKGFILKSDKDGWENLYYHDNTGKLINQITTGTLWGTSIVKVDEKAKLVYFRARKENSARFDFYKVGLDGKNLTRLSFGDYSHDQVNLSPNGKYFITTYSNLGTPPAMALVDAKGKQIRVLGDSKGSDFDTYALPKTELVRVKSDDGVFELPVTITYPVNFDPNKKYPVLVSIYGGPNAGTVYDRWKPTGGATQWWAQEGMIQVAFDNRSSGHFGKIGLNYIHRQLGKWEIEDYMACGKWLKKQSWVDSNKLAMTGGSFGGYMTCMALTYGASVFNYGIANASVTDWQFYDTHYTERFMDTPKDNAEGYKNTAVMSYAAQYKGLLRVVHGTSDDNVHMQNSLTLIDKMQNLGKRFEFMVYPGERHGIGGNNAKKALHNRNEAYAFWYKNLLGKPMPAQFLDTENSGNRRGF